MTTWDSAFQEAKSHARDYRAAGGVKERETNGAQLTSHGSYLQLPRIFKDCKESLFYFSNKENTPRNKKAAIYAQNRKERARPSWSSCSRRQCVNKETSEGGAALGKHTHPPTNFLSPLPQAMERKPQQRLKTQSSLSQAFIFSQLERKVPIPSESGTYRSNTR